MSTPDTEVEEKRFITIPKGYFDDLDLKIEVPECPYCEIRRALNNDSQDKEVWESEFDEKFGRFSLGDNNGREHGWRSIEMLKPFITSLLTKEREKRDTYWKEREKARDEALLAELESEVETLIDQNDDGMWAGRETADHILSLISSKRMK